MKFLHVLGEIFSPHAILENPCQPRRTRAKAGKTVKNHGTFAAVICFVLTLQKADGVTTNDANP
ncbi:hypothetical protein [Rhizobium phaseoli]|uniref:hypothetical protein n=1 Tax=Rhizobium phaseoli TaxID=396 RepID=UPI00123775C8|nr:hypothetical protein [Rhizobium phaseoli]